MTFLSSSAHGHSPRPNQIFRRQYIMTYRDSIIAKYQEPGMTKEQAEILWKEELRKRASNGGKNGTGHEFAHGKVAPSIAGIKSGRIRRARRATDEEASN